MKKEPGFLRRYHIVSMLLIFSAFLMFIGLFSSDITMRLVSIGIILSAIVSFVITWVNEKFISRREILTNFAIGTSYAFFTSIILIALIFILDSFLISVNNVLFAVFSSIFVGIIVSRWYIAKELESYLKW